MKKKTKDVPIGLLVIIGFMTILLSDYLSKPFSNMVFYPAVGGLYFIIGTMIVSFILTIVSIVIIRILLKDVMFK